METQKRTIAPIRRRSSRMIGGDEVTVHDHVRLFTKVVLVSLMTISAPALQLAEAVEIGANLTASVGYSGNISKIEQDQLDEITESVGFRIDLTEDSARFKVNIRSNARFVHYDKDSFDDELIAGLSGLVDTMLVEDRLTWITRDIFGHQATDPLQAVNPANRDSVNFFTTGPNLRLPLGRRAALGADLRYTNINYSERPFDNERSSARIWLGRQVREHARVSINAFVSRTEFSEGTAIDFDHREAFFRFDGESLRNKFGFDVGYTELIVGSNTADGYLVRADWTRAVTGISNMVVRGGTRYSDEGDVFSDFQNITRGIGETENIDGVGQPFRNNFFNIAYNTQSIRTWVSIQAGWSQEDYTLGFDRDRDIAWGGLLVERDLSNRTFLNLRTRFSRREYKYLNRKDDDIKVILSFGYRFSRTMAFLIVYRFEQRNSTAAADYKEHRGLLRFRYTPDWGRMKRR